MFKLLARLPTLYLFRSIGWPPYLPLNLTLSPTFKCNSRCLTCNIFKKSANEMSLEAWRQVFFSLGHAPFWVTISGGEPFIRNDLPALVAALYDICRPSVINIPTNGMLADRIPGWVAEIARRCVDAQIIINLSIDELGARHDKIRGVEGNFAKAMQTFHALKQLHMSNLTIGFHTVISRFNVDRITEIYDYLMGLGPDSVVAEIAEAREELGTIGADITPSCSEYSRAVDFLIRAHKSGHLNAIGKVTRALRIEYHRIVRQILKEQNQAIPCYAGFASGHIAPNGDVWACCTRAESMGNLKRNAYDFKRVWFSRRADQIRDHIKEGQCWCPLANASYSNMLFHPKTLLRVGRNFMMGD